MRMFERTNAGNLPKYVTLDADGDLCVRRDGNWSFSWTTGLPYSCFRWDWKWREYGGSRTFIPRDEPYVETVPIDAAGLDF